MSGPVRLQGLVLWWQDRHTVELNATSSLSLLISSKLFIHSQSSDFDLKNEDSDAQLKEWM